MNQSARQMLASLPDNTMAEQSMPVRMADGGAVTDAQIRTWLAANPGASDAQISQAMNTYGVSPARLAAATGYDAQEVTRRYDAVNPAWTPGDSVGRQRAIERGDEAGWLAQVKTAADKYMAQATPGTAAEAYDTMIRSGIGIKDLLDSGVSQTTIDRALTIETAPEQTAVNTLTQKALTSTLSQNPNVTPEVAARGTEAIYTQARQFVEKLQKDGVTPQERQYMQQVASQQGWGYSDLRAAGLDPGLLFNNVVPPPVVPPPVFPEPKTYTPVTVYDPEKFAREQGGDDLYKKGEVALDTAFRSSPVRQVSPTTGQYTYTPAASLRPATGSGWSWKPPVVTSRPRELLDVGPTASASQQYAQSRQQQDRALRDAFASSNLPMSGANTYYWQSRLRGGDYSPGGTFDPTKFGQDFQSWAANQGSGTSGTAGQSQTGGAVQQNQQMYDESGNPLPSTTANPNLAMAPKMFLGMQPELFADGGEARARELLDRIKKPEGAEEQVPGAEEPGLLDQIAQKARRLSRTLSDLTPMGEMEDYATRTSTLFYPKETELGGEADAMRHMLFQSELADRYGRLPAAVVGALNEYGLGMLQGQSSAERRMDFENDARGREVGTSGMNQDERLRAIMERIDAGNVTTVKESQLGYADGGEVTTEELIAQMDRVAGTPNVKTEEPEQTESRSMLRRINDTFGRNVTAPVLGSIVDMSVGLGDIGQFATKYLANRAGIETAPVTPVASNIKSKLGLEYDPYHPVAIATQLGLPALSRARAMTSAASPAVRAVAAPPGSAKELMERVGGEAAREGQIYVGSELGAQTAREIAPDNAMAEIVGAMIGGTAVNTAQNLDPRTVNNITQAQMASYNPNLNIRGREYPFVGRLDQYVADNIEGTLTKDQFLGQIRPKFREYDILRAQQALSDLGGKDKVTASDLLTRLEQVYDPADFKTSMYRRDNLDYASMDNPWRGSARPSLGSPVTGRFGVIALSRGGVQGEVNPASSLDPNRLNQGLDTLRSLTQDRGNSGIALELAQNSNVGRISILRNVVNDLPESTQQRRLRYYISDLEDAVGQRQSIAEGLDLLQEDKEFLLKSATQPRYFEPAYREAMERGGAPPEQLLQQAFNTAISRAYASQMEYLPGYNEFFPTDLDLTGAVNYNDKVQAIHSQIGPAAARAKQKLTADTQNKIDRTLTSMEGYMPEFEKLFKIKTSNIPPGSNPGFKGQHPQLSANDGNQIGFSRFTELEAVFPEIGAARGIYVHELQADLLDDIRKKGMRGEGVPELEQRLQGAMQEKDKATLAAKRAQDELDMMSQKYATSYNRQNAGDISSAQGVAERAALDQQSQTLIKQMQTNQNRADSVGSRVVSLGDALRDAKIGWEMPNLDESFPGMERNSKAVQQLLIRNAVAAAVARNYQFVALTSPEHSAQPQLYQRIPQNARDVVKDLGEGFRVVDLTLEGSGGPFKTTAIVWGNDADGREGVNRVLTLGVPFAQGGEATSKPDDIKNLLSFLDK